MKGLIKKKKNHVNAVLLIARKLRICPENSVDFTLHNLGWLIMVVFP